MEESLIWLNRLLTAAANSQFDRDMTKSDFQQLLLYWLAGHIIDWDSNEWQNKKQSLTLSPKNTWENHAAILMYYCGRIDQMAIFTDDFRPGLSSLVQQELQSLNLNERLALFDSLFYRVIAQVGIDRRHAQIGAALANGLMRKNGLIELDSYSAEPFVVQVSAGKCPSNAMLAHKKQQDLLRLRLALYQIDVQEVDDRPEDFDNNCLTLLDLPADQVDPLSTLYQRLESGRLTERTLVLFKPNLSKERLTLEKLKTKLLHDDLLEAIFDFTSYNVQGKPIRFCAWLLNRNKHSGRETLCIDTRKLLRLSPSIGPDHLAWFAAAVCELWASTVKSRIRQYPHARLGPLQGLFGQHFNAGYEDVAGICRVRDSEQVLRAPFSGRHVPTAPPKGSDYSLLDRHLLQTLLESSNAAPLCVYIIGNNGAGKSLLLASLPDYLQKQSVGCVAIASGPSDRFVLIDKKPGYRYLGDRTKSGYSTKSVERKLLELLTEAFAIPGRAQLFEQVLEPIGFKSRLYLAPMDLFSNLLPPLDQMELVKPLEEALREGASTKGMTLALSWQDSSRLAKFADLSSGEQQVLLLLSKVAASAGPGKVMLIDEPEISLHVRWQQLLPGLFSRIAEQLQSQFVIATHSPTLIANAQDKLSHCFLAKDLQLEPVPREQRHSVETILLEGFKTYTPHNREIAERCAAVVAEAIKATNHSQGIFAGRQKQLDDILGGMDRVMRDSGNTDDKRYDQDRQLITQARQAIKETFNLAKGREPV